MPVNSVREISLKRLQIQLFWKTMETVRRSVATRGSRAGKRDEQVEHRGFLGQ